MAGRTAHFITARRSRADGRSSSCLRFDRRLISMVVRLALATLTSARPDIMVMDEVIGAGDDAFMKSARKRLENFMAEVGILVVAPHSLELLKMVWNRGVVLHHGEIHFIGSIDDAISATRNCRGAGLPM